MKKKIKELTEIKFKELTGIKYFNYNDIIVKK